jgi:YcaO-like protein with predicted kinase domain
MCDLSKSYFAGTQRSRPPEETLAQFLPMCEPAGLTRLADVTGLDDVGVPVWTAVRPLSRSYTTSQGKGPTPIAAKVSALMEALEMWHAELVEPSLSGVAAARLGDTAADVRALPAKRAPRADELEDWVLAHDVATGREAWVPFSLVSCDFEALADGSSAFVPSSNGLASGNHLLEALSHALCELVERDAEALWRASGTLPLIALETVEDATCRSLIDRFEQTRTARLAAWSMPTDVPATACGALLLDGPASAVDRGTPIAFGYGAHLDPAVALSRAITEAAQTRATYVAGSREDFFPAEYERALDPGLRRRLHDELDATAPNVDFRTLEDRSSASFEHDVDTLLDGLGRVGLGEVLMIDLTRRELGLPVVRAIVPGLEAPVSLDAAAGARVQAATGAAR